MVVVVVVTCGHDAEGGIGAGSATAHRVFPQIGSDVPKLVHVQESSIRAHHGPASKAAIEAWRTTKAAAWARRSRFSFERIELT